MTHRSATEDVAGQISLGSAKDVDRAVDAARRAFPSYSATAREEHLDLLKRIIKLYEAQADELSRAMTAEKGRRSRSPARCRPSWR